MGKFGKWIGAGLGWAFGGPIGAILGFGIGSIVDAGDIEAGPATRKRIYRTTTGDFIASLLVLVAAVMKADGKVLKSELDYVKGYLVQAFGPVAAADSVKMLRDIMKQAIPVKDVCLQIRYRLDHASRLQMLHFLYGIANADGKITLAELRVIEEIGYYLGISSSDQKSIKNMFVKDTDSAYKILGIDKSATNEEVKKAYRKLAVEYHPDKVSYLGEDIKKAANEKFRKVNEAYETIKNERGMK